MKLADGMIDGSVPINELSHNRTQFIIDNQIILAHITANDNRHGMTLTNCGIIMPRLSLLAVPVVGCSTTISCHAWTCFTDNIQHYWNVFFPHCIYTSPGTHHYSLLHLCIFILWLYTLGFLPQSCHSTNFFPLQHTHNPSKYWQNI